MYFVLVGLYSTCVYNVVFRIICIIFFFFLLSTNSRSDHAQLISDTRWTQKRKKKKEFIFYFYLLFESYLSECKANKHRHALIIHALHNLVRVHVTVKSSALQIRRHISNNCSNLLRHSTDLATDLPQMFPAYLDPRRTLVDHKLLVFLAISSHWTIGCANLFF